MASTFGRRAHRGRAVQLALLIGLLTLWGTCVPGWELPSTTFTITPAVGPAAGGAEVVIQGQRFTDGMVVQFGGANATNVELISTTALRAITPAHDPGVVDVTLFNDQGYRRVMNGAFEFEQPPAEPAPQVVPLAVVGVAPTSGPTAGGTSVTAQGVAFDPDMHVLFGEQLGRDLEVVSADLLRVVSPPQEAGDVALRFVPGDDRQPVDFGTFTYVAPPPVPPAPDEDAPRIVSAVSTSNTSVRVTFNEALETTRAETPSNYAVGQVNVNREAGSLLVVNATQSAADPRLIELTTLSQNEVVYELTVTGIQDLAGNTVAPPELLNNPTRTRFVGTPFDGDGSGPDSDGDGLTDAAEQRGWVVRVRRVDGSVFERQVTSNYLDPDTDDDGLSDQRERNIGTNPRSGDTDADEVGDAAEWNKWFSDPTAQDTDGDTLNDELELTLGTSPTVADTDGDQFSDYDELTQHDRDPRIADLPEPQIVVGEARLTLDVRTSFTDETGTVQIREQSLATTLARSQQQTFGRTDTTSTETVLESGQEITASAGIEGGVWSFGGSISASFGQKLANGFTSSVSRESAQSASSEYQDSVTRSFEASENRAVTRTIEAAEIVAEVSILNKSNIAFSLTNLELSVLQQDRRNANQFIPIAALRLEGVTDPSNQPVFNLGPFEPERGPFIFVNDGVFPALVEELLREPQGLVYRVVNFDVLDEFGRNFVFSSQDVSDRTVGLTIDFGEGVVERYRIATNNRFGPDGRMLSITMADALAIVGLMPDPAGDTPNADPADPLVQVTYGMTEIDGVQTLTRVRGVQAASGAPESPEAPRFWALISANRTVPVDLDFDEIPLRARDDFLLVYTRDQDEDGLLEYEEIYYGSSDTDPDTDDDTLGDLDEVRSGWAVTIKGEGTRQVFPSPASSDTDLDGLRDDQERAFGTDPTRRDSDFDGLSDETEIFGPIEVVLFDGDDDETNNPILRVPRYAGDAVIVNGFDGVCRTLALGDDVQVVAVGAPVGDGDVLVTAGPNGSIDSIPGNDGAALITGRDDYIRVAHDQEVTTDPRNADTDFDGLPDGRELFVGANPNRDDAGEVIDSDNDGLSDAEEDRGWLVSVDGGAPLTVTSDKFRPDTDRDGIPDVYERAIASNPRLRDTDGDGLFDYREFDINDEIGIYNALAVAEAGDRCADATDCQFEPATSPLLIGTDPRTRDTDGDGRSDPVEINEPWSVDTFAAAPYQVFSDPKRADADLDGLVDGDEQLAGSDPTKADTDGDGRQDGVEVSTGRDPLRQDYVLTVTLTTVDVIDDCDSNTCEGLEMQGDFKLARPNGSEVTLHSEGCKSEECACEVRDCCDNSKCAGESFSFNDATSFVFREGESFRVFTGTLIDNDDTFCPPGGLTTTIGQFSQTFNFSLSLATSFSRQVGGGDCQVRVNYAMIQSDN